MPPETFLIRYSRHWNYPTTGSINRTNATQAIPIPDAGSNFGIALTDNGTYYYEPTPNTQKVDFFDFEGDKIVGFENEIYSGWSRLIGFSQKSKDFAYQTTLYSGKIRGSNGELRDINFSNFYNPEGKRGGFVG